MWTHLPKNISAIESYLRGAMMWLSTTDPHILNQIRASSSTLVIAYLKISTSKTCEQIIHFKIRVQLKDHAVLFSKIASYIISTYSMGLKDYFYLPDTTLISCCRPLHLESCYIIISNYYLLLRIDILLGKPWLHFERISL